MYESLHDLLRAMTGEPLAAGEEIALRGRAWLTHALLLSGLPLDAFARKHVYRGREDSNLVKKWRAGDVAPTRQSAVSVERTLRNSLWVFDLPLWELFGNRPLGSRKLAAIAKQYLVTRAGLTLWLFPGDEERIDCRTYVPVFQLDTQRLVYRNDLWGFVGTLLRTRQMEAEGDVAGHIEASKNMYRALPAALRLPWLRPYAREVLELLNIVRSRMLYSALLYDIDEEIILRQTDDPTHEPNRERRSIDPRTRRFLEVEDPILPAQIVPGRAIRDKARRRAWPTRK